MYLKVSFCLVKITNSFVYGAGKDWGPRGEGGGRGWDGWLASLTQWTWVWANSGRVTDKEAWYAAVCGVTKSQTRLRDWTTTTHFSPPKVIAKISVIAMLSFCLLHRIALCDFFNMFFCCQNPSIECKMHKSRVFFCLCTVAFTAPSTYLTYTWYVYHKCLMTERISSVPGIHCLYPVPYNS